MRKPVLVSDGIRYRDHFWRSRIVRFDEIASVAADSLETQTGDHLRVGATLAQQVAPIVSGPELNGSLAANLDAFGAYVDGPHSPRVAARVLMDAAAFAEATDIHVEPSTAGYTIRFRIEGTLTDVQPMVFETGRRIIAALKGMASCLPYRRDIVQEGRIPRDGVGADVRASFVPTAFGERIALRLFGRLRRLDELGLSQTQLGALCKHLEHRTGLILIAGASGAGKTTTIYAALAHLADTRPGAHLSLEDPVEQRLRMAGIAVDQVELQPERGITGEAMLVAALRQDVDVLAVGEVRTSAEAQLALHAAHTGRLVLAGVHAGSVQEAQTRLLDLEVERSLLDSTLRAVLWQDLPTIAGRRTLHAEVSP